MDKEKFLEILEKYGGPERVLGFGFNNGMRKLFTDEPFSLEKNFDDDLEVFVFEEVLAKGTTITVVKPLEFLEHISFIDEVENINKIDARLLAN